MEYDEQFKKNAGKYFDIVSTNIIGMVADIYKPDDIIKLSYVLAEIYASVYAAVLGAKLRPLKNIDEKKHKIFAEKFIEIFKSTIDLYQECLTEGVINDRGE